MIESGINDTYDRDWFLWTKFEKALNIVLGPKDIVRTIGKARKKLKEGVNDMPLLGTYEDGLALIQTMVSKKFHEYTEKIKE